MILYIKFNNIKDALFCFFLYALLIHTQKFGMARIGNIQKSISIRANKLRKCEILLLVLVIAVATSMLYCHIKNI